MLPINKFLLIIIIFLTVLSVGIIVNPQQVKAEWPSTGAICFNYFDQGYYKYVACPTNEPAVNINNRFCYANGAGGWTDLNCGTVLQANTECARSKCMPGATVDGMDGGKSPSGDGGPSTPSGESINNAERNSWANCQGGDCMNDNPLIIWTRRIINFLAAGVGVIVTIMIIVGGIQYASAGPNPQAVQSAKKRITNAIIALVAFFFVYGFMQWLIPGGIFN